MKRFKNFMVLFLALVMVCAMTVTAFAEDKVTITINPPSGTTDTGETYEAYKIFDVVKSSGTNASNDNTENKGFAYTISPSSPWLTVVQGLKNSQNKPYFVTTLSADGTSYAVTLNSEFTLSDALAKEIAGKLLDGKPSGAAKVTVNSGTQTSVDPGYYLITSSLGSNLILATTDININEKNNYPSITKAVAEEDQVAQIGQDVTFNITMTIPDTADKVITLTDTMSQGLTFKEVVSCKNNNDADVAKSVSSVSSDTNSFTITFDKPAVTANRGKTITIVYTATLNNNAVVSALNDSAAGGDMDDNTNEVTLRYSNFSQSSKVDVNTVSFQLKKYDASDNTKTPIAGAKFKFLNAQKNVIKLYKVSDTEYRIPTAAEITANTNIVEEFTTVANTPIAFKGVDSDLTYYLRETQAPAGYNKLSDDVQVKPKNDLSLVSEVGNNKGNELPSTGGIGTKLFYLVGSILTCGAFILLVVRRRMESA